MIKRPLNSKFNKAVLCGRKITTIRENPWPIGKPIMLYNWSGRAYNSPQINVAPVIVTAATAIDITLGEDFNHLIFSEIIGLSKPLWHCEGFDTPTEMHDWFMRIFKKKRATTLTQTLMCFTLYEAQQ